jgi:sugar transferase EpsL
MRRLVDILVAVFWLLITAPVMLLLALLLKLEAPGSIFYRPRMLGLRGRQFTLFRFRTMDAGHSSPGSIPVFTRLGGWMRHYSLDHLPMLINLLNGDLTLVGPRPMELNVVDLNDPIWQRYFQVKPGLINYAVLKLARQWTPTRASSPELNQALELDYSRRKSAAADLVVALRFLGKFIASRGNVKARGKPDAEGQIDRMA